MLKIPEILLKKYHMLLDRENVPSQEHNSFEKWLRYYLDFCKKYQHPYSESESLELFIDKLRGKKQDLAKQTQAKQAILLYYSGISKKKPGLESGNQIRETVASFNNPPGLSPWEVAMKALDDEIKLRHYSPKTFKSYSVWIDKLKYFTKIKLPETLTASDVKAFLTFLAVERKVSASSQNQAFNALLFFFRHVLHKEFGKTKSPLDFLIEGS